MLAAIAGGGTAVGGGGRRRGVARRSLGDGYQQRAGRGQCRPLGAAGCAEAPVPRRSGPRRACLVSALGALRSAAVRVVAVPSLPAGPPADDLCFVLLCFTLGIGLLTILLSVQVYIFLRLLVRVFPFPQSSVRVMWRKNEYSL